MPKSEPEVLRWLSTLYERGSRYWADIHDSIREERAFYEGQHYAEDIEPLDKNSQSLRFVGPELFNLVRHKHGQLTASPHALEARPVDEVGDADDAERAVQLIEWEAGNPQKCFAECDELMCLSALAARIGIIWIDYDPDEGKWGEILFRPGNSVRFMMEPGFHDPHDIKCGWIVEESDWPIEDVLAIPGLKAGVKDRLRPEQLSPHGAISDLQSRATTESGEDIAEGVVRVRRWMFKHDRSVKPETRSGAFEVFADESQRYMVCGDPATGTVGCGWRSEGDGTGLPEEGTCPDCGGPTTRIDGVEQVDDVLVYPRGRRMILEAPNQNLVLYDGKWPVPKARSFPLYYLTAYASVDPTRPTGPSDTLVYWTPQAASDFLMTKGFQALAEHQRYFALPKVGVTDAKGRRYEFRDDQFNVMYYDEQLMNGLPRIDAFEGSSLDAALPGYWNMVQTILKTNQGISDLGMSPQDSKNVPATSILQMTQMAEIPIEHLKRRYHRAVGKGHGVLWDYIRSTYPAARLARLRLGDGTDSVETLRGDELPNFDFVISDTPPFSGLEASKSEALEKLIALSQAAPEWLEVYADVNNFPRSIVRKVQQKASEMTQMGVANGQPGQAGQGAQDAPPNPATPEDMVRSTAAQLPGAMGLAPVGA